jgi:hypothetical protein
MSRGHSCNLKYQPAKKIIFVFLVLTLVSSVSTITFVTGNVNLAFAKKHDSSGSSGGSSGSSSDNSGGGSSSGGSSGSSSDNSGGTTTGGSDTSGGGGTSNTPLLSNFNTVFVSIYIIYFN